ncbi:flagellar M-ring protein FliF C-terminal domain-containing protein [Lachnospiraceae bacterium 45-W7]
MQERIKNIPRQSLEWWNKFSVKQKTVIASITLAVIVALVIVVRILTTPTMVSIRSCEDTKEAAQVKELLEGSGITYEVSNDGLNFSVKAEDEANAAILLGENGIPASRYELSNVFDGGFSNTEADKSKKYQLYLQEELAAHLEKLDNVESASVKLSMPVDDGTVLALENDTYAAVTLSLSEDMDEEKAGGLARWIATAVGNDNMDDISIMDSAGNVLFAGGDSATSVGAASSQLSYKTKAENMVKSQVKDVILGTGVYDSASVGLNLDVSFDEREEVDNNYYTEDGAEHGPVASERIFEEESNGADGGVPGTDTNNADDTMYTLPDGTISSQTVSDTDRQYNTSNKVTTTKGGIGDVNYDNSSITVVANQYRNYSESALRSSGQLDDMTFDEFVAENREKVKLDVDPDFIQMVSKATGFSEDNIVIVAYEVPFFEYADSGSRDFFDYLPIIIAVLIMLMLGYVVFRSTRKEQVAEPEPELSVESLLASTKEAQENLEDIGFSEKSETRVLIEKFVDENPEAVASLLRNWLNEEWE